MRVLRLKSDLLLESRLYYLVAVLFLLAAFTACSSTDIESDNPKTEEVLVPTLTPVISTEDGVTTVVVHISPTGEDGQTGTATFVSGDSSETLIQVSITPPIAEAQPIHLHSGTCDDIGPVLHGLQNVVRGDSVTLIGLSFDDIARNGTVVNVHASYADASNYTACRELPEIGLDWAAG